MPQPRRILSLLGLNISTQSVDLLVLLTADHRDFIIRAALSLAVIPLRVGNRVDMQSRVFGLSRSLTKTLNQPLQVGGDEVLVPEEYDVALRDSDGQVAEKIFGIGGIQDILELDSLDFTANDRS